ncbi:GtrA family protein [Companilactobacillus tucceti DSM 20183]|uniref:GtrA family protein n=1 Tax=Companilactobacillus tucceti DSM 20183 TaxID=1423811 RepID=A0A0R1IYU4_9LACO|nr:GtrA family protein [Companilactobacillus tucceti]KRK63999.1 GtrA family protein [Companilactobacillus tucceti DSM 20183]
MEELWNKYKDTIPYLFFGVLTTVVNIVGFWFFNYVTGLNYQIANVIAYFLSVVFAYVTNKLWVFDSHTDTMKAFLIEMGSFFLFRGGSWVIDQGTMTIGVSLLHMNDLIVKFIANVVVVILNYIFSKFIIFRKKEKLDGK